MNNTTTITFEDTGRFFCEYVVVRGKFVGMYSSGFDIPKKYITPDTLVSLAAEHSIPEWALGFYHQNLVSLLHKFF